jgi:hypothetical protein
MNLTKPIMGEGRDHQTLPIYKMFFGNPHRSPGTIKINWDVGFDKANGRIGLGMIAYDYKGFVLAARI